MRRPCSEKRSWSKEEDQKLIDYIQKHGEGCWPSLPQAAGLSRCGKSCRLRWLNYLKPDIKRGDFGDDEEDLIIRLHALLGNRWSLIAGRLPGRTDNEVKNYWNSHIRKKLIQMGHDHPNNNNNGGDHRFKGSNTLNIANHKDNAEEASIINPVNLHNATVNNIIDEDDDDDHHQVFEPTSKSEFNLNDFPELNLDLTLTTTYHSSDH